MDRLKAIKTAMKSLRKACGSMNILLHEAVKDHLNMMYVVGFEEGQKRPDRKRQIVQVYKGRRIEIFQSLKAASDKLKVNSSSICNCLKVRAKHARNYQWYYLEDWEKKNGKST